MRRWLLFFPWKQWSLFVSTWWQAQPARVRSKAIGHHPEAAVEPLHRFRRGQLAPDLLRIRSAEPRGQEVALVDRWVSKNDFNHRITTLYLKNDLKWKLRLLIFIHRKRGSLRAQAVLKSSIIFHSHLSVILDVNRGLFIFWLTLNLLMEWTSKWHKKNR